METFNLTIKFDTEEARDLALDKLANYKKKSIIFDGDHFFWHKVCLNWL